MNNSPSNQSLLWLMLGLTLGALPHFYYQPIWVAILFLAMIGWRCMNIWQAWPLPSIYYKKQRWIQRSIAALAIILLLTHYGNLIGRDAGVALLTVMLGLKVTEIRSNRDYYLSSFLGYFLVVTNFFYSQSMITAGLMFVVVIIMTASLISLNDLNQSITNKLKTKLAGQMLLQAVPLMVILFIFFPRISGPLWGLPDDAYNAKTGIDNSMTLGAISKLIQSDEVAFRVKFDDTIPEQANLYWRGPVLWHSDGTTWTELNEQKHMASQPNIKSSSPIYRYTTTIEPHNNNWLFALDFPLSLAIPDNTYFTQDGQLKSNDKIKQRKQYSLSSQTQFTFNAEQDLFIQQALQLPDQLHPRTRQLAQKWRNQTGKPNELIQLAINYFNQQPFYYTLEPPVLTGDIIDQFLFESRQGFCEHYAASFTVLMRAAGVPTRIVTGYQGGEVNPVDNFFVIRQRDAHAWTEVWIQDQGWIRIDPTAAVSKERIEQGMSTVMPLTMRSPLLISHSQKLAELWQTLRNNFDALDNKWNQWILAYGPKLQKQFLSKLGMPNPNWQQMVLWLGILISTTLLLISLVIFYHRKRRDPIVHLYQKFCHKTALKRGASEGPVDFAERVKQQYPHHAKTIDQISQLYINLHYGDQSASIGQLKEVVKEFNPKKK